MDLFVYEARFQVGQNLAIQFSTNEMLKANWASMIQSWYDEVRVMKPPYIKAFPYVETLIKIINICYHLIYFHIPFRLYRSNPIGVIGHYTQMVWAQSFKVGCGIISYRDTSYQPSYPFKLLYVCNCKFILLFQVGYSCLVAVAVYQLLHYKT